MWWTMATMCWANSSEGLLCNWAFWMCWKMEWNSPSFFEDCTRHWDSCRSSAKISEQLKITKDTSILFQTKRLIHSNVKLQLEKRPNSDTYPSTLCLRKSVLTFILHSDVFGNGKGELSLLMVNIFLSGFLLCAAEGNSIEEDEVIFRAVTSTSVGKSLNLLGDAAIFCCLRYRSSATASLWAACEKATYFLLLNRSSNRSRAGRTTWLLSLGRSSLPCQSLGNNWGSVLIVSSFSSPSVGRKGEAFRMHFIEKWPSLVLSCCFGTEDGVPLTFPCSILTSFLSLLLPFSKVLAFLFCSSKNLYKDREKELHNCKSIISSFLTTNSYITIQTFTDRQTHTHTCIQRD